VIKNHSDPVSDHVPIKHIHSWSWSGWKTPPNVLR